MKKKAQLIHPIQTTTEKAQELTVSKPVRRYRGALMQTYITLGVILFVILAFFAHLIPYFPIDLVITRGIQSIHSMWFTYLMQFVSYIGFGPQVDIMVVLIIGLLLAAGLRWEAIVGLINAITATTVNLIIKDIIHRPRPGLDLVHVFSHLSESSFPSGHVMFYTAFFGYLWFLTYTLFRISWQRKMLLCVFSILIFLIAPSRIYLGAHWASDVFGAYLLGSIWLLFTIQLYHWGKKRFFIKQPTAPESKKSNS